MKPPRFGSKVCKYAMVKMDESMSEMNKVFDQNGLFPKAIEQMSEPFEMANCTAILTTGAANGERLPNGSYTGIIGEMVKGEINGTGIGYMLGSEQYEPVHVGSVYFSTQLQILSLKDLDESIIIGMESWMYSFDLWSYYYLLICLLLFNSAYILSLLFKEYSKSSNVAKRKIKWHRVIRRTIVRGFGTVPEMIWRSLLSLIGIYQYRAPSAVTKLLTVSFTVGIFNLVFGYFLNLVSTDMFVVQRAESIDILADLLESPKFQHLKVTTLGGLWQEHALRGAIPGSPENRLWNRINGNSIPIMLDQRGVNSATEHGKSFLKYEEVTIMDSALMPLIISGMCQLKPDIDPKLYHLSSDWFGERLLVPTVSQSSDPALLSWINNKFRQLFQSDLLVQLAREGPYSPHLREGITYHSIERCIRSSVEEEMEVPGPFGFKYYAPLIVLCASILLIALAILMCEIFMSNLLQF